MVLPVRDTAGEILVTDANDDDDDDDNAAHNRIYISDGSYAAEVEPDDGKKYRCEAIDRKIDHPGSCKPSNSPVTIGKENNPSAGFSLEEASSHRGTKRNAAGGEVFEKSAGTKGTADCDWEDVHRTVQNEVSEDGDEDSDSEGCFPSSNNGRYTRDGQVRDNSRVAKDTSGCERDMKNAPKADAGAADDDGSCGACFNSNNNGGRGRGGEVFDTVAEVIDSRTDYGLLKDVVLNAVGANGNDDGHSEACFSDNGNNDYTHAGEVCDNSMSTKGRTGCQPDVNNICQAIQNEVASEVDKDGDIEACFKTKGNNAKGSNSQAFHSSTGSMTGTAWHLEDARGAVQNNVAGDGDKNGDGEACVKDSSGNGNNVEEVSDADMAASSSSDDEIRNSDDVGMADDGEDDHHLEPGQGHMKDVLHRRKHAKVYPSKRILERKRRERMNASIDELRRMIPHTLGGNSTKMDKAEVLEKTVKYMRELSRPLVTTTAGQNSLAAYSRGFNDCVSTVINILLENKVRGEITNQVCDHLRATDWQLQQPPLPSLLRHQLPPVVFPSVCSSTSPSQTAPSASGPIVPLAQPVLSLPPVFNTVRHTSLMTSSRNFNDPAFSGYRSTLLNPARTFHGPSVFHTHAALGRFTPFSPLLSQTTRLPSVASGLYPP